MVAPPPSARLVAPPRPPPPTRLVVALSFDDSPSDSSGYNDKCPTYKLLLDFNYLIQLLNVYTFIFRLKS
jgi:hypothetical protein